MKEIEMVSYRSHVSIYMVLNGTNIAHNMMHCIDCREKTFRPTANRNTCTMNKAGSSYLLNTVGRKPLLTSMYKCFALPLP